MSEHEYQTLRSAFFVIYADIVSRWRHQYDHTEAEQMFSRFIADMENGFADHWTRALVS